MAEWDGTPPGPEYGMSAPDSGAGLDESVRPRSLDDFIGQDELRANLRVYLDAARERGKALDHTLFYGNPGLGKTTLAQIMASELGVNLVFGGHYFTETFGVKALGLLLKDVYGLDYTFIDLPPSAYSH